MNDVIPQQADVSKLSPVALEADQRIAQQRNMSHSRVTNVLDWVPYLIHTVGKPVARAVGETVDVTLTLIGETLGGAVRGGKAIHQALKTA